MRARSRPVGSSAKYLSRDEAVIATKVFMPMTPGPNGGGLSRKHILSAIDASLQRLDLDYVDLYQIHRWDPNVPIEETMDALNEVVRSGKARYIGASSMHAWQFAKAQHVAERNGWAQVRLDAEPLQPPLPRGGAGDDPAVPSTRASASSRGARWPAACSPGTAPATGEKHTTRSNTDPFTDYLYSEGDFDVVDRVVEVAGERGVPPAQVALAWLLHRPGVTAPIVGATKLGHLEDAIAAEQLDAERRRDAAARGALRAAPRPRPLTRSAARTRVAAQRERYACARSSVQ